MVLRGIWDRIRFTLPLIYSRDRFPRFLERLFVQPTDVSKARKSVYRSHRRGREILAGKNSCGMKMYRPVRPAVRDPPLEGVINDSAGLGRRCQIWLDQALRVPERHAVLGRYTTETLGPLLREGGRELVGHR